MSRQECKRDKRERHQAALYRAACRTRRSINTHSGSSLSSSSLRGDDLHTVDTTEQVPGLGGGVRSRIGGCGVQLVTQAV
jgi:hypothetical protein